MNFERQPLVFRFVLERTADRFQHAGKEDLFGFDRNRSRLDFRKIENVADKVQQVCACAVNGAGKLHLLGSEIATRVFGQLLAENENTVERRT